MKKKVFSFLITGFCFFYFTAGVSAETVTLRLHCWKDYAVPYTDTFLEIVMAKYNRKIDIVVTNVFKPEEFWNVARGKKADLISPAYNILKGRQSIFIKKKMVLPVNPENIPNYKYVLPFLQKNRFVTEDNQIYGVPYSMGAYGLAYNAEKVNAPESWGVLWQKNNRNRYTISRYYPDCNIYITALTFGVDYRDLYDYDGLLKRVPLRKFQAKLDTLSQYAFSMWDDMANHEEFDNLDYATTWGYGVAMANKNGGNWKIATPKEGTTMWVDHWAITHSVKDDAFKKKLCEEWINYCLSPDRQVDVLRSWGASPVVSNINDRLTKDEISTFHVGNSEYWSGLSLWESLSHNTTEGYKGLWRRAVNVRKGKGTKAK